MVLFVTDDDFISVNSFIENLELSYLIQFRYVTTINLSNNKISWISNCTFSNVKHLDLTYNRFKSIDNIVSCFPNLETLNLNNNYIKEIKDLNMLHLRKLSIQSNKIENISINSRNVIERLDLCSNKLTVFNNLPLDNLTDLNISNNEIELLSGNYPQLTNLFISYNKISTLSSLVCPKLEVFSCSNNLLSDIENIRLNNLKHLEICFNKLTLLDLENNKSLIKLYASSNLIKAVRNIPRDIKVIDLTYNKISEINEDDLVILKRLNIDLKLLNV